MGWEISLFDALNVLFIQCGCWVQASRRRESSILFFHRLLNTLYSLFFLKMFLNIIWNCYFFLFDINIVYESFCSILHRWSTRLNSNVNISNIKKLALVANFKVCNSKRLTILYLLITTTVSLLFPPPASPLLPSSLVYLSLSLLFTSLYSVIFITELLCHTHMRWIAPLL